MMRRIVLMTRDFEKGEIENMRHPVATTLLVFGIIALAACLPVLPAWADDGEPRLITVTGDAEVHVVPDEVVITLGIETSNKGIEKAQQMNDARVQEVLAITEQYDIPAELVQTEYINIEPRYESDYEQRNFLGYFVQRTVVVTLKDLSRFESFLTDVLAAGVNYVHGIEFRTTELRKYRDQARSLAIQAAKEKAIAMTAELDQTLGSPHTITENQSGWWSSYSSWWGSRWGGTMAQNVVQNAGEPSASTEGAFAPGQIVVKASISVSFEMEEIEKE